MTDFPLILLISMALFIQIEASNFNVQDYVNNKNKFFALESVFKKAYAMLKNNA